MTHPFQDYCLPVYACPNLSCLHVTVDPKCGYDGNYCPVCGSDLPEPLTLRDATYITVAVYEVSRSYGGAEEGGWYYDEGSVVVGTQRSFLADDAMQMEVYRQTMLHRYQYDPMRGWDQIRHSVRAWADQAAPARFPEFTPRYC